VNLEIRIWVVFCRELCDKSGRFVYKKDTEGPGQMKKKDEGFDTKSRFISNKEYV